MKTYKCLVCGYIHEGNLPPDTCPICDAPKELFEEVKKDTNQDENFALNAYRCLNCEYIHSGDKPPEFCPVCGYSKEHFEPVKQKAKNKKIIDFKKVVILGGGIAALSAAETLRDMNEDLDIIMITNESKLPYYRLNLTRYLAGEVEESDLCIHHQYWYDEKKIMVYKNRVITSIDKEAQVVKTGDGLEVTYDRLIMALGSHSFRPPIKGANMNGIISLRSLEDAQIIKNFVKKATRVFIIGGGVLGLETAGALSEIGAKVTIGEGYSWLMPRQLNEHSAMYVHKNLKEKDIHVEYGFRTDEILKSGKEYSVFSDDGRSVDTDLVILATGVRPNTYLARIAGLEVNRGVVVNDCLQSSDSKIYAVGDLSEHYGVAYGLWNISAYQGKIAAMNVLGEKLAFGGVPRSNALKVLDIDVFSVGSIKDEDASYHLLEKSGKGQYICFYIRDNIVVGSIAIGYKNHSYKVKKLVEEGVNLKASIIKDIDEILKYLEIK